MGVDKFDVTAPKAGENVNTWGVLPGVGVGVGVGLGVGEGVA